jgi:hypothetical protein
MAEDGRVRIGDRTDDTFCLRFLIEFEAAVNARDDKFERLQDLLGKIQRSVGEDVGFDAFKNVEGAAELFVEPTYLLPLVVRRPFWR